MVTVSASNDDAATSVAGPAKSQRSISGCGTCGAFLALVPPDIDNEASAWLCGKCGAAYFARRPDDADRFAHSNARPVAFYHVFQAANLQPASPRERLPHHDLHRVLRYLATIDHWGPERRGGKRNAMALPVMTLPLDKDFRVTGPAAGMTTINISRSGGALLSSAHCEAKYLAIDLTVAGWGVLLLLFEVLRSRPLVSAYEVGGRWVCRINPLPSHGPNAAAASH